MILHIQVRKSGDVEITSYKKESSALEDTLTSEDVLMRVSGGNTCQDASLRPNYVEHEGITYHIARFLGLIEGKVYIPQSSRKERWRSANMDIYFENLAKKSTSGEDGSINYGHFVAVWTKGSVVWGKIERLIKKLGPQTSFAVHNYKLYSDDTSNFHAFVQLHIKDGDTLVETSRYEEFEASKLMKVVQQQISSSDMDSVSDLKALYDEEYQETQPKKRKRAKEDGKSSTNFCHLLLQEVLKQRGVTFENGTSTHRLLNIVKQTLPSTRTLTEAPANMNTAISEGVLSIFERQLCCFYIDEEKQRKLKVILLFLIIFSLYFDFVNTSIIDFYYLFVSFFGEALFILSFAQIIHCMLFCFFYYYLILQYAIIKHLLVYYTVRRQFIPLEFNL